MEAISTDSPTEIIIQEKIEFDVLESVNPRSMAFSHIETILSSKVGIKSSVAMSEENSTSPKKIDMEIIDRIKNMRCKSRESNI